MALFFAVLISGCTQKVSTVTVSPAVSPVVVSEDPTYVPPHIDLSIEKSKYYLQEVARDNLTGYVTYARFEDMAFPGVECAYGVQSGYSYYCHLNGSKNVADIFFSKNIQALGIGDAKNLRFRTSRPQLSYDFFLNGHRVTNSNFTSYAGFTVIMKKMQNDTYFVNQVSGWAYDKLPSQAPKISEQQIKEMIIAKNLSWRSYLSNKDFYLDEPSKVEAELLIYLSNENGEINPKYVWKAGSLCIGSFLFDATTGQEIYKKQEAICE